MLYNELRMERKVNKNALFYLSISFVQVFFFSLKFVGNSYYSYYVYVMVV